MRALGLNQGHEPKYEKKSPWGSEEVQIMFGGFIIKSKSQITKSHLVEDQICNDL